MGGARVEEHVVHGWAGLGWSEHVVRPIHSASAMSAREVITFQCGHYSNFIGTHWWNIQVSVIPSLLYVTPSTLSVPRDLAGERVLLRQLLSKAARNPP